MKSRRRKGVLSGLEAFAKGFKPDRILLVGGDGIPLEEFLSRPAGEWMA